MRRAVLILLAVLAHAVLSAQQVVIDPSQIAASATNAAEQVDYMIDQLGELAYMGEQLGTVKGYIDEIFGEDGVAGKAITVLEDLGTLERLTASCNSTIRQTRRYAEVMNELGRYRLTDASTMLSYLVSVRNSMEMGLETARHIINTLGFSKKEKKEELDLLIGQMEQRLSQMEKVMEIETRATIMAEGITQMSGFLDENLDPEEYVLSRRSAGTLKEAGKGTLGVMSVILALLGIVSGAYGMLVFVRGGISGDPFADNIFIRIAVGVIGGLALISLIAMASGLNL